MTQIVFTANHCTTAEEAIVLANKILVANGLPLVTYGGCGGGGCK